MRISDWSSDVCSSDLHHEVVALQMLLDVGGQHRRGHQVVVRDVEEALDLVGMQVQRQHAVGAGGSDQVGDQLGRDRRARAGLAVLAGIAEIGRSEEHTSELQSLMRISYAVFYLNKQQK